MPAGWQQRLQNMSPEEREHFLQNNARFRSLPKEQQDQIRKHFAEWDKLSAQQKARMQHNNAALQEMTDEQRQNLRTQVMPKWQNFTPEQRHEISQRLHSLDGLSDAERNQKLNDPNFYQGLTPQQQDVMKQFGEYRITPGGRGL